MSADYSTKPISHEVSGDKDASPYYREVFEATSHGGSTRRFRVVIEPRVGDRYVDVWSRAHDQWHRVHSMKWEHPLADIKASQDLYKGGKYQASDFKACRDELVRVAFDVVFG